MSGGQQRGHCLWTSSTGRSARNRMCTGGWMSVGRLWEGAAAGQGARPAGRAGWRLYDGGAEHIGRPWGALRCDHGQVPLADTD